MKSKLDEFQQKMCTALHKEGYTGWTDGKVGDKPKTISFKDNDGLVYIVKLRLKKHHTIRLEKI